MTKTLLMPTPNKFNNPIINENYKGKVIRRYNTLYLRLNQFEMKKFIDMQNDTKLTFRELIEYSSEPCQQCKDVSVHVFNKEGDQVSVPRGLLSNGKK